jgi:hypothetical protein
MRPGTANRVAGLLAICVVVLLSPLGRQRVRAQTRPLGDESGGGGWAPVSVGARVGLDNRLHEYLVGGLMTIPLLPNGSVELMPNMDVTFVSGANAYQYNLELAYVLGGREGGLYVGGGVGFRKARFSPNPAVPRESVRGYTAVVGIRLGGFSRLNPQLETRWVFLSNSGIDPQQVSVGATVALWGRR